MQDMKISPESSERALIGCILSDGEALEECMARVKPVDFYDAKCRSIYGTILKMAQKKEEINIVSVSLHGHEMVDLCGLMDNVITAGYRSYMNAVLTAAARRKALAAANDLILKLNSSRFTSPDEITAELNNTLNISLPQNNLKNKSQTLCEIMSILPDELEKEAKGNNLKYGWRDLDGLTGGLWPGELTIIAASPGAGKTAFALNIAKNAASQGGKVLFVSLEMSAIQLGKRLCSMCGIEGNKLRRPKELTEKDWISIANITEELGRLPITIDGTRTIQALENKCVRLRERGELDLLILDYLGLLRSMTKAESRRLEVEYVSRSLKLLALELCIPIIALSQMNREGQKALAPSLNDLRESGSLEQDADNVLFLHDPQAKENLSNLSIGINVIIAKQRSGQTGRLQMRFDKRYMRFYEKER